MDRYRKASNIPAIGRPSAPGLRLKPRVFRSFTQAEHCQLEKTVRSYWRGVGDERVCAGG